MAAILVRSSELSPFVEVERDAGVPEGFWLRARSEWGSAGPDPGRLIEVPVERFLSRTEWLRPACSLYGVGITWDERSRALMLSLRALRSELDERLADSTPLTPAEVRVRLDGSRFTRELLPFQERDLGHLLALPHGANFSVPGAGKTTVAYALYEAERVAGRIDQLLVVAPLSAFDAWLTEAGACFSTEPTIHRFDGGRIDPEAEVLLTNYQRLHRNYGDIARWVVASSTHVILDEAHRMKGGRAGAWGSTCLDMAFLATRRDILTGTPAPQSPQDMVALMDYVWPNQARRILPPSAFQRQPPADVGHQIAVAIRPLFARTRKRELPLRDPDFHVVEVPLEGLQQSIYEALRNQYAGVFRLAEGDRLDLARMGDVVMYLLEAATNPALLPAGWRQGADPIEFRHPPLEIPPGSELARLIEEYARFETPRKLVTLATLVEEKARSRQKTLVWSNFVRNLETLEHMLARYRPALIHGGIPSEVSDAGARRTREGEIDRFRHDSECLVLLANPAAMSEGISLHDVCHEAIYVDRTFNAGQYLQSIDRIHRLGMEPEQETNITLLVTVGTVDEIVDRRVAQKADRLGDMLDDPDISLLALPNEDDYGPALDPGDADDIRALFAHLRGEDGD